MEPSLEKELDTISKNAEEMAVYTRLSGRNIFKTFVLGIFYGLGATVGLSVFLALLTAALKLFGGLPLVGDWAMYLGNFVHK